MFVRVADSISRMTQIRILSWLTFNYKRVNGCTNMLIPVIPFLAESGWIAETVETVPAVANVLETRINTG
jgi:hypothetical protein